VFTQRRPFVMDRNFPGVPRIARLIERTHVLIRVKSDIRLDRLGDFAPDGSYVVPGPAVRRRGHPDRTRRGGEWSIT
jgi:hypothetical protein